MEHVLNWMSTHYENSKFAQAKEFLHNRTVYRIKLAGILLSTLTVLITMIVCTVKWFNIKLTKEGTIHCETGINCLQSNRRLQLSLIFLSEQEKRRLCLNRVRPLKSPQPKLLD